MKKIFAAVAACLCIALACVCGAYSADAESSYNNVWYALRGEWFAVPDADESTVVSNPGGENVTLQEGKFRATFEGDYIITQGNSVSVLKVYRTAPAVTVELDGTLKSEYCAGEIVYLPVATGKSEIKNYTDYEVEIYFGGEPFKTLKASEREFVLSKAGEYSAIYVFTDVFGKRTEYKTDITALNKPVIVMQRFPETAVFGTSIGIDATYGYYNGVMYECSVTLKDRLKTRSLEEKIFSPVCDGLHELTFTCVINGETLTETARINVEYGTESFFVTSNIKSVVPDVPYPSAANVEKNGVYITGDGGAVARYTKTLNLKELSQSKTKIIEFQPYAKKGASISEVRVTLTDALDAKNTLSAYWWMSPWNEEVSYMLVEYGTQAIAISNESADKGVVRNQYGTVTQHTFNNVTNKQCAPFNFRYDYDGQIVYSAINSSTPNYKVLDTDNTAELKSWKPFGGFKGEDVYLSVELTASNNAGVVISEIGGEILNASTAEFVNDGVIQILRESNIQTGVVGYGYLLPRAQEKDVLFGDVGFTRTLEYFEEGVFRKTRKTEGAVEGDVFMPKRSGEYRARFTGLDNFGSSVEKFYEFEVKELPDDIFVQTNAPAEVEVRSDFILPAAEVSGGTGKLETSYQVCFDGKYRYMQPGERIYADRAGSITVSIIVRDELGFVKTTSYSVPINTERKFIVVKNMPQACVNGEKLELPEFTGLDYSKYGTDGFEFPVSLYVNDVRVDLSEGYTVNTSEEFINVTFVADDGSMQEMRRIRVIPSNASSIADFLVFERESISTEFYETGLTFSSESDMEIAMPYALPYYELSLKFTVLESCNAFDKIDVIMTGARNEEQEVTLSFSSVFNGSALMKADGKEYTTAVESGTYGVLSSYQGEKYDAVSLSFSRDGMISVNGTEIAAVSAFDSGRVFGGFDGGKVRVSFRISGVNSSAKFVLNLVANQSFTSYTQNYDEIMPVMGLVRDVTAEEYQKGSVLEVPEAVFADVLSGKVTGKVSVFSPSGAAIVKDAELNEKLSVTLDSYGYYRFEYTLTDGARNTGKRTYRVHVADVTPPKIEIGNMPSKATAGDSFTVPEIKVTDDNSSLGEDGLQYFVYLRNPDTLLVRVFEGKSVKFEQCGTYKLIVYAIDGSGNINYKIKEIVVNG